MTQKFTLLTTTPAGNKIQNFTNIRDWFITFMQQVLKVNTLGYLELLETDKTITLNLHDKATNNLVLTLYHNSDITKGYILANGLYYFNQQDVIEDKKAKSKNKLAYQFGMPLAELKELYFDYTIFRYFFDVKGFYFYPFIRSQLQHTTTQQLFTFTQSLLNLFKLI